MEHKDEIKKKHYIVPGGLEAARMLEKYTHEIVEISRYAFKEEDVLLHQLFNEWFKRRAIFRMLLCQDVSQRRSFTSESRRSS